MASHISGEKGLVQREKHTDVEDRQLDIEYGRQEQGETGKTRGLCDSMPALSVSYLWKFRWKCSRISPPEKKYGGIASVGK